MLCFGEILFICRLIFIHGAYPHQDAGKQVIDNTPAQLGTTQLVSLDQQLEIIFQQGQGFFFRFVDRIFFHDIVHIYDRFTCVCLFEEIGRESYEIDLQVSAYLMNLENTAWQDRDKTSRFNLELRQVDGGLHLSTQAEHEDPRF